MSESSPRQITSLIGRVAEGDENARSELYEAIYSELKRAAESQVSQLDRRPDQTLQPTALVHEVFLRLHKGVDFSRVENRRHFFGIAVRAMQQILITHYRQRKAQKRGGHFDRVPLDEIIETIESERNLDVEVLHEALERLGQLNVQQADVVRRKFFGGQTHAEIACDLGCSISKIESDWRIARNWLRLRMREGER